MSQLTRTQWSLISAARSGDEAAIRNLVGKYRPAVVSFVARRGHPEEAEDIAQEVLLRLFEGGVLQRADPERGRFRNLLLTVVKRTLANYVERQMAKKRGGGKVQRLGEIEVAAPEEDPDFDREWIRRLIELGLARLATEHPNYHKALSMFLLGGKSQDEIAEALGSSKGSVKNHVHRGKQKLVAYIREEVWNISGSQREYLEELTHLSSYLDSA